MFVTVSAGSVVMGWTMFQLISEREVPLRERFQLRTQVWKLVCSSHQREEFLRSCWIELRHICRSQIFLPVSKEILWKQSIQAISMWEVQVQSSIQRRVHAFEAAVR